MTDACYWIAGSLLFVLIGVWLNHRFNVARDKGGRTRDEQLRELRRNEGLKMAITLVLSELKTAQGSDALLNKGDNRNWRPKSTRGLTELRNKGLLSSLSPELQDNLHKVYGYLDVVNSAVSQTVQDGNDGAFRKAFQRDPVDEAVNPIRKPCLEAIEACIPEIEKLLSEGDTEQ